MEEYRILAAQIQQVRFMLNSTSLELPNDKPVLAAYENLSVFVTEKFKMPESHADYIYKSMGLENRSNHIVDEIKKKKSEIEGSFGIELSLRGIESYFSWGRPKDIPNDKLKTVKYLIAKTHSLVGDKLVQN